MDRRKRAVNSGLWSVILQWSRFGLNTIVFLVLARWLTLAEIGAFATAFAPIRILQIVQRTGFSEAIIQGDASDTAFTDATFWISIFVGFLAGIGLFSLSFAVGDLFGSDEAASFMRAMSVIPVLIGCACVAEGILRKRQELRVLAIRTLVSVTASGLIALYLGYNAYGGWALVAFAVVNAVLSTLFVVIVVKWAPGFSVSMFKVHEVFKLVGAISGRALAYSSIMPVLQLLVAGALGTAAAGAFQIAQRFLTLAQTITTAPFRFALLPVMVQIRDDKARLQRVIRETVGLLSLISSPIYFGLIAVAPTLLPLALGPENGTASTPVLQAMLLIGATAGLYAIFTQLLTATSRTKIALYWAIVSFFLSVVLAIVAVQFSVTHVAAVQALLGLATAPFVVWTIRAYFNVPALGLIQAAFMPVLVGVAMASAIYGLNYIIAEAFNPLILLLVEIIFGAVVYGVLALAICREQTASLKQLFTTLRKRSQN